MASQCLIGEGERIRAIVISCIEDVGAAAISSREQQAFGDGIADAGYGTGRQAGGTQHPAWTWNVFQHRQTAKPTTGQRGRTDSCNTTGNSAGEVDTARHRSAKGRGRSDGDGAASRRE